MNTIKKGFLLFLTLCLIACKSPQETSATENSISAFDFSTVEKFKTTKATGQIVNDYDDVFTLEQRQELSQLLYNYNLKTTRQIAIVTVETISPYQDIQRFATDLGKYWGVGTKKDDNGMIFVICNPCRQLGIATGTGTEKVLTNDICKRVIDTTIIPQFKNGNFYDGIKNGVLELMEEWN
ncbi:YgcG family protein [Mangrovimonas sp. YM274]|uniref:TPM domain-containing protein n=1 Tax=Mangrovimonas sp. YM274 TaxID=3070660 RepID=UPI0027DE0BD0|nr:TPM domain-containing protein [Mangrovimonas sp. YM274]WMI67816.1 TPM domain-containing protein [Mangrovimonas sp. YM274]